MRILLIIIWTLIPLGLLGQSTKLLTATTKEEFESFQKIESRLLINENIIKTDKTITIKLRNGKTINLKDDLTDKNYRTYEYFGDIILDSIVVIKFQDYNTHRYIAIDLVTGDQKIMIGRPKIHEDNIVCLQGVETDVTQIVEYWTITDMKLSKIETFDFGKQIYPVDLVLTSKKEIIVKDSKGKFWRTKLDSK